MGFPIEAADPASLGLDPARLARLCAVIEAQVAAGEYPGAQVAVARHGRLALFRGFGLARTGPTPKLTDERSLFLLYSNTKVLTAATLWTLVEDGLLRFGDRIADHIAGFDRHRKGEITLIQLLTHQGGFPSAVVPPAAWTDHALLREIVCDFRLEWAPGSRVHYHPAAAHWVAAVLIEQVTGQDYREAILSRVIAPLGLADEVAVGLPAADHGRAAEMYDAANGMQPRLPECSAEHRSAGIPGGGGYASARGMAAFYQMLVQGGRLEVGGVATRIVSPRMLQYATRNFTGERVDMNSGMPMHRGLGPHVRGDSALTRGLGTLAHPRSFGHGGAGSSFCWGDPESGVSFSFLSNARHDDATHDDRMEVLSNMVHAAIVG